VDLFAAQKATADNRPKRAKRLPTDKPAPKTGYLLYCNYIRAKVVVLGSRCCVNVWQVRFEHPDLPFADITRQVAKMWKELPEEERAHFNSVR
jgi:hypothetical protein